MLRFGPGRIVSEEQLNDHVSVSRTPIREVLQRYAHSGLVLVYPLTRSGATTPVFWASCGCRLSYRR